MALLSPNRFTTGPTGTRKVLPGRPIPGAAVKAASPGLLYAQLAKAGAQRCEQA
jgi:hypothetical protein